MDERSIEQLRLDIIASCTAPDLLDAFEYRIRAEARAEAAQIVRDERDRYYSSHRLVFDSSVLAAFDRAEATILADEPKEREESETSRDERKLKEVER